MADNTSLVTTYVVNKTNQFVMLTLLIGGAEQTGTSTVELDTEILIEQGGDLFDFTIGKNKDLADRTLVISTTISDTSRETNHTELIVRLKGGVIFREYALSKEVDEGGKAIYFCEIDFFQF